MARQPGVSFFSVIVATACILAVLVGLQFVGARRNAQLRDLQRLGHMRQAEAMFAELYLVQGSYAAAARDGCATPGDALSQCNGAVVHSDAAFLKDPGRFSYIVTQPPNDTGYAVSFVLEQSHGTLAAGYHTLTPQGIQ